MSTPTNRQRASYARAALNTFRLHAREDDDRTLILDLIADLGHLAAQRWLDFVSIVTQALKTWMYERTHPDGGGDSPGVTITIEDCSPKRPRRTKAAR